jgi:hypothetical protein
MLVPLFSTTPVYITCIYLVYGSVLLGVGKDLDPLLNWSKFLLSSRGGRYTKRHNRARLVILGQAQQLHQPSVDFLVHASKVLKGSSESLLGQSSPDDVLQDTGRVLGPGVELLYRISWTPFW